MVMFGIVAAIGIRILRVVDFQTNRNNVFIVAAGIGFGMIPLAAPLFFSHLPKQLEPILNSGVVLTVIVAVILNVFFNGVSSTDIC